MSGKASELVEVTWSGKTLFLNHAKLDEWYHQNFEDHVYYVETHPWIVQKIPLHNFEDPAETTEEGGVPERPDPNDYVMVQWSGKSLLLARKQLDDWYHNSFEHRVDYVHRHPSCEINEE
jgi:hypothetical protein